MHCAAFVLRAVVLVLPVAGCVLVVPEIEHDAHCAITGSSECGTCLRTNCQMSIDSCCDDASCSGAEGHSSVLDALDACANGNKDGCASGLGDAPTNTASTVRTCVTTSCQAACLGTAAVAVKWTCATPRTGDNDCAKCVYGSCATALDSCCSDSSCSKDTTIQQDVSACVAGDEPGCVYMTTHSSSGAEGVVRACIEKECNPICFGDFRTHQSCDLYEGGSYCQCSDAEKTRGPDCSTTAVGGTCVASLKGCICGEYSCGQTSTGCSCSFRSENRATTTCSVATTRDGSGKCCVKLEEREPTCRCSDIARDCAGTNEYSTETCDSSDVMKVLKNLIVPSCTN